MQQCKHCQAPFRPFSDIAEYTEKPEVDQHEHCSILCFQLAYMLNEQEKVKQRVGKYSTWKKKKIERRVQHIQNNMDKKANKTYPGYDLKI